MVQLEIIEETPITMSDLKDEIAKIRERDTELNFRVTRTEEHLQAFITLDAKKAAELFRKIEELEVPRLKPVHITNIVDLLPATVEQLKVVLQGYSLTISNENLKKVAELVKDYSNKKK